MGHAHYCLIIRAMETVRTEMKDYNLGRISGENLAGKRTADLKVMSVSIPTLAGART